jgi:activator of HSP90 ATPase
MAYDFTLSCTLPAKPETVYDAWLDSASHAAMTGGAAEIERCVGGAYSAWDGYITGRTLELIPGKRIIQSWRTSEFDDDDPDSTIIVELAPTKTGARLTLTHRGVPDGQTDYEKGGWQENYFAPMRAYFGVAKSETKPTGKPAAKGSMRLSRSRGFGSTKAPRGDLALLALRSHLGRVIFA